MLGLERRYVILTGSEDARPIKKTEFGLVIWRLKGVKFETQMQARDLQPFKGTTVMRDHGRITQVKP